MPPYASRQDYRPSAIGTTFMEGPRNEIDSYALQRKTTKSSFDGGKSLMYRRVHHTAVSYQWVKASGGYVPPDAVQVGFDGGNVVYVARAEHEGTYIPGKMLPVYSMCYIPCDGKEIEYSEYEILTDPSGTNLDWREALESDIPPGAVQGGTDVNGDPLYIGRVRHAGAMCSGKVQPTDGVLYVPYGGAEHIYESFEFLVMKDANS